MSNTLTMSPAPLDTDAMRAHVAKFRRWTQGSTKLVLAIVTCGSLGYSIVTRGLRTPDALFNAALILLVSIVVAIAMRPRVWALKTLESKSGDDLLAGMRAELDHRLFIQRLSFVALPIFVVAFQLYFAGLSRPPLLFGVFEFVAIVVLMPLAAIRYRRWKRERAQLA